MCRFEIWDYRECGCQYHHHVPCSLNFDSELEQAIPFRRTSLKYYSRPSSASVIFEAQSLTSSDESSSGLQRQCSIRETKHKTFLEPICDDCLLTELGLGKELGPILGGRDHVAALDGQDWLLESNVEIQIEEEDSNNPLIGVDETTDYGIDADDECERRGRPLRRKALELDRPSLTEQSSVSSLSQSDSRSLLRSAKSLTSAALKVLEVPTPKLARQYFRRLRKDSSHHNETDSSRPSTQESDWASMAVNNSAEVCQEDDTAQEMVGRTPKAKRELSWNAHLTQDLGPTPSWHDLEADCISSTYQSDAYHTNNRFYEDRDLSLSSNRIPSSPQTASIFSDSRRLSNPFSGTRMLNIPSSEFSTTGSTLDHAFIRDSIYVHGDNAISDYQQISSSPSSASDISRDIPNIHASPISPISPISSSSTRPTTSESYLQPQLSLHPLATPLKVSAPTRASFTSRSSSLFSPPSSSPLLHSTPPLKQSLTSAFVCVHDIWRFSGCGCEVRNVKSCVCEIEDDTRQHHDRSMVFEDEERLQRCQAKEEDHDLVVRKRDFMSPVCEDCLRVGV